VSIICKKVSVTFPTESGRKSLALADLDLEVKTGEFLVVVGPSGSGKSTLLRLIAGLVGPSTGTVTVGGPGAEARVGMVFQGNSVFPWRTVAGNLAYALEARRLSRPERSAESTRLCRLVGLDPDVYLGKYPKELSGGETRRVAIGMALGVKANVLLLDEPTSQLDYAAKLQLDWIVQELWTREKFSAVYVTHDIDEAILLADRIVVLRGGRTHSEHEVALRRPRDVTTLATPDFADLRGKVLRSFEG
jgi:NitT/TauT family transport system ATP-binding protein